MNAQPAISVTVPFGRDADLDTQIINAEKVYGIDLGEVKNGGIEVIGRLGEVISLLGDLLQDDTAAILAIIKNAEEI